MKNSQISWPIKTVKTKNEMSIPNAAYLIIWYHDIFKELPFLEAINFTKIYIGKKEAKGANSVSQFLISKD